MSNSVLELPARESLTWQDWSNFLRAYKQTTEVISQILAQAGMPSLVEYSVLYWLNHEEAHRVRQTDISRGVLVSKSRVTRLLNSMVEHGWVRREKTSLDKRVTFAVLTDKGLETYARATPIFAEAFHTYFSSRIPESDRGELSRLFSMIAPLDDFFHKGER